VNNLPLFEGYTIKTHLDIIVQKYYLRLIVSQSFIFFFEKGKPIESWGRKATDLREDPMVAEFPKG
jgi:hypothetical protein